VIEMRFGLEGHQARTLEEERQPQQARQEHQAHDEGDEVGGTQPRGVRLVDVDQVIDGVERELER
jgi:hypothetical protein